MILKRFYDEKLAQASYLLGCSTTREALVVDPHRDVDVYSQAAAAEGLRITHVTETHIHADFVSGARELAARTSANLYLSDEGDSHWKYDFADECDAVLLRDGDAFDVGDIRIDVLHTPGHTPEHLSFLVTDRASADRPMGIITGDFVFVGDVGRPDLLEKAAGVEGTMDAAARTLFQGIRRFLALPDYLQVWPGHGAGSACGKGLGAVPQTTVGYERMFNWAFSIGDEDEFVDAILTGQPAPPKYFAEMKRINKEGPKVLGGRAALQRRDPSDLDALLEASTLIIDTRPAVAYARGHIPGTINIPLNRSFITWAGWLVPYDREFHLIIDDAVPGATDEVARDLAMIGLDRSTGYLSAEIVERWSAEGRELGLIGQITSAGLSEKMDAGRVAVLDVRGAAEWAVGHLPGVPNVPLGDLTERLGELPRDLPLVVHCQGGGRSAIAASILRAQGFDDVANLEGGYAAWRAAGYPITERQPA